MSTGSRKHLGLLALLVVALSFGRGRVDLRASEVGSEIGRGKARNFEKPFSFSSISGPMLGIIFDSVHGGLTPILGIPGASTVGDVLDLPIAISQAWVAPQQDYALAKVKGSEELVLLGLNDDPVSVQPIVGATPGIDWVSLSPTGASACLYQRGNSNMQVIKGLPQSPAVVAEIDLSTLPRSLGVIAISDEADAILLSEEETGSIYVVTTRGEIALVAVQGQTSAISFLSNTRDALIADRRNNEVWLIRDVTGAAVKSTLAGEQDGIQGPVAVQISDDNRRVFIANSASATISVLDLSGGMLTHLPCGAMPSGLYRLRGRSLFRLTELSEALILLLDGAAEEPRILFVPRRSQPD